jgi:hypothetical protein
VVLTGWLRTGEPQLGRDLPPPQLASISIADARTLRPELAADDVYVVLGAQQPPVVAGEHPVRLLPRPEEDLGPHQAYAYQWWLFMPGALVFVVLAMRRELAAGEVGDGPEGAADRDPEQDGDADGRRAAPARPVKAKKVRIWDEEDA